MGNVDETRLELHHNGISDYTGFVWADGSYTVADSQPEPEGDRLVWDIDEPETIHMIGFTRSDV